MTGHGDQRRAISWAAGAVLALTLAAAAAWWAAPTPKTGDIDPLGAALGLTSTLIGAASTYLSLRAWRGQQTDTIHLTGRLADTVRRAEERARAQLLGNHDRAIDLIFTLQPAPAHAAAHAAHRGHLHDVLAYYDALHPRRLVVTGDAGAGKTALAVELTLRLLETRHDTDPVPVRLPASSWQTDTQTVEAWLTDALTRAHGLTRAQAKTLVDAQKILPVIDGLDEMDATTRPGYASRAGHALRALNTYQQRRAKAALVLTCRTTQYQALQAARLWVHDAAHVRVQPVQAEAAHDFLTSRVVDTDRWHPVLTRLGGRNPLARALTTPWRLTLAVTVYEQRDPGTGHFLRDPADLTSPALRDADAVRDHLNSLYVPAVTALRPASPPYRPDDVHRWLSTLAAYLHDNRVDGRRLAGRSLSGTDLVPHELWPLAGPRRVNLTVLALTAAIWLAATPVMAGQASIGPALYAAVPALAVIGHLLRTPTGPDERIPPWDTTWRTPSRLDPRRLRGRQGLLRLATGAATGITLAAAVGVLAHLTDGITGSPGYLLAGTAAAALTGVLLGGAFLDNATGTTTTGTTDPWSPLRSDYTGWIIGGLVFGVAEGFLLGLILELTGNVGFWLTAGIAAGLTLGPALGFAGGLPGLRYLALILCTRRRLPWRLAPFLTWAHQAGLLRISGGGYQFRHQELQEHLAHAAAR